MERLWRVLPCSLEGDLEILASALKLHESLQRSYHGAREFLRDGCVISRVMGTSALPVLLY